MAVAELTFGAEELAQPEEETQLSLVWNRFKRHRLAIIGSAIALFLVVVAVFGPMVYPYDPNTIPSSKMLNSGVIDLGPFQTGPDGFHLLGTDGTGRDYLARLMAGGRVSLAVAFVVTLISSIAGMIIGGISGYLGGWLDSVLMRLVDWLNTLPFLPLIILIYAVIPQDKIPGGSVTVLFFVLSLFGWTGIARFVRASVLSLKTQEFTDAARVAGASNWQIIQHHMLPNSLAPVIVSATLGVGGLVVAEAALSFLGYGVRPPDPSWGNMLSNVQSQMLTDPWKVLYPGMCIFLISLSFNFIGDALRDALDPRLKL